MARISRSTSSSGASSSERLPATVTRGANPLPRQRRSRGSLLPRVALQQFDARPFHGQPSLCETSTAARPGRRSRSGHTRDRLSPASARRSTVVAEQAKLLQPRSRTMQFRILGPLEVIADDGRALPLPRVRQRAFLAVMLLHAGEVVSTDRLLEALWGDLPPRTAREALQNVVSQVRKVLPPVSSSPGHPGTRSWWPASR